MLKPIAEELKKRGFDYKWYIPSNVDTQLLSVNEKFTQSIKDIYDYEPEAIFVPGNEVPWYLSGVKTQIFHGMAGEKKGHFRIRDYFDLYLTQGPYFTERFDKLAESYKNFSVKETGWAKLDSLFSEIDKKSEINNIFAEYNLEKILLYAPTFSPSLCSAKDLKSHIKAFSQNTDTKVIIKFHDKMDASVIAEYKQLENEDFVISNEKNIIKLMQIADAMLSDTSSVVYEFLLLGKPVFTYKSSAEKIYWSDSSDSDELIQSIRQAFSNNFSEISSTEFIKSYHPYQDGLSAKRNVDAVLAYIDENGVPVKRKLPFHRKFKLYNKFKYIPSFKTWF